MNSSLKVTVITVCLNCRETIEHTVESVLSQTYGDIEYIVVDGQSADGTLEYLVTVNAGIDKFVSESDGGVYDAMNKGVSIASGDYIIFMNGGDRFASNDAIKNVFDRVNAEIDLPNIISGRALLEYKGKLLNKFWKSRGKRGVCLPHQATFVSSKIHKDNLFDARLKWVGDFELWQRLKSNGLFKVFYVPDVVAIFSLGGKSNQVDLDARRLAERAYVDSVYAKNFGSYNLFKLAFKVLLRRVISGFLGTSVLYGLLYGGFRSGRRQKKPVEL